MINNTQKVIKNSICRNIVKTAVLVIVLFLLIVPVNALKLPSEYGNEQCELIAKDYQNKYFGDLILIQPLKDNGAYDLGEYNGHWINKAYSKELGIYYIDYKSSSIFSTVEEVKDWYEWNHNKKSEVFNYNQGGVPFAIYWHY